MAKKAQPKKTKKKKTISKKRESKQRLANCKGLWVFLLCLGVTLAAPLLYCFLTMPNLDSAINRTRQPMTTIAAENGKEIQTYGNIYQNVVMLYDLKPHVVEAIVSTEDHRFYSHFGFDPISFTRAMFTNLFAGRYAQGGSTISQQVAKNLFLTQNKTIKRKVQELMLAFWLENKFSKDQILTLYINRVYLGSNTYGIEAAAQKYFSKSAENLNLHEATIIAGMLKAPSKYNPLKSKKLALARASVVLKTMEENKIISADERAKALKMPIGSPKQNKIDGAKHFADWAYREINTQIGEREADIKVLTTLNQDLQEKAQKILNEAVQQNKGKNVTQGAIVVIDKFGGVRALVGGTNYDKSQFNRATQALRQPGSTFKTFVYMTALLQGYSPDVKIYDKPIKIGKWRPENSSGKYYGSVRLDYAFAKSLNMATVNLSQKIGVQNIIKTAKKMGISSKLENTPSLALGTSEVTVLEMAKAYAVVANGGYEVKPYVINEVYTKDGYKIYQNKYISKKRILDEKTVTAMKQMLEKVVKEGTGKKAHLGSYSAGKTGTSQESRDAWFVGFNENYVTAVWFGNDNNAPMKGISGGNLPTETWKKVMINLK
ncbi:MAG: transglycosylase domain-containing protein [Alphaproteobacteria bacterium]